MGSMRRAPSEFVGKKEQRAREARGEEGQLSESQNGDLAPPARKKKVKVIFGVHPNSGIVGI